MPRTAVARSPRHDDEATMTHVDELIQRGRGQGHLSLPELRTAFGQAGISATEAKSILRELSEDGVRLGNDPAAGQSATAGASADDTDGTEQAAAVATAPAAAAQSAAAEVDLDDHSSVMGDSVHTYLKSIGRTSLLTAEQEVNLAKRIEAGLYAEHKLATA